MNKLSRLRGPAAVLLIWGTLIGFDILQTTAVPAGPERQQQVHRILVNGGIYVILTSALFWCSQLLSRSRIPAWRVVLLYIPVALCFSSLHAILRSAAYPLMNPATGLYVEPSPRVILNLMRHNIAENAWVFIGTILVAQFLFYKERARLTELEKADLQNSLTRSELHALKMQLQPHFLFNALNSVAVLTERDPTLARRMIAQIGDLIRTALTHSASAEVTLEEELRMLETYIQIERVRFEERLEFKTEVETPCLKAFVPHLLLQPIVENSIRHGISKTARGGTVTLRAKMQGDHLVLEVQDTGPGLPGVEQGDGIGLSSVRSRLKFLYNTDAQLWIDSLPLGGTLVRIQLPLH